jgi:hypothetical protein
MILETGLLTEPAATTMCEVQFAAIARRSEEWGA